MGYRFKDDQGQHLMEALQATPSHALVARFEWDDPSSHDRTARRYALMIAGLSEQEARQRFNASRNSYDEYLTIGFVGELPPSILKHLSQSDHERGWMKPLAWEGFMHTLLGWFPAVWSGDWVPL